MWIGMYFDACLFDIFFQVIFLQSCHFVLIRSSHLTLTPRNIQIVVKSAIAKVKYNF